MVAIDHYICPSCHVGHLDLKLAVYVRRFGETLISVPNTPAWVCDTCRESHFDPESVQRIELLVGQAGPPPNHYRPSQARMINRAAESAGSVSNPAKVRPKGKE